MLAFSSPATIEISPASISSARDFPSRLRRLRNLLVGIVHARRFRHISGDVPGRRRLLFDGRRYSRYGEAYFEDDLQNLADFGNAAG
jgi:hypothetical protein